MVYIFNIKSLPLYSGERVPFRLVTLISFLNLGLAGFVLAAVAARFIFPGISLEGRQMWLLRSSPLDPRAMLWSKYWIGTVPLLLLALIITVFTNWLLHASAFMMAVGIATIVFYTLAASALALSFGALYPQFGTENAAQIPTSFGGLVYMMSSLSLLAMIIMIEAGPVTAYLGMDRHGGQLIGLIPELIAAGIVVVVVCVAATMVPLRLALRRIEMMEW
jgi:ABC-2 type transport system permease protein